MQTVSEWLIKIKSDPKKLNQWLQRQYIGEFLAADRILNLLNSAQEKDKKIIEKIAYDEAKHCSWIKILLVNRGLSIPLVSYKQDRYWKEILPNSLTQQELYAAGHHAEKMRLKRIEVLAKDKDINLDIRETFNKILQDEKMHTRAFKALSNPQDLHKMETFHQKGLVALGLVI